MDGELRELHLRGATGKVRTEMFEGREHLVVPIVALMEGVIHAVNADSPEFVSVDALRMTVHTWDGRPLMYGHPAKDGKQLSANSPQMLEAQSLGRIFNTRVEGKRLLMDGYVDIAKAEKVGGAEFVAKLRKGEVTEVSVGAHVHTELRDGDFNGKKFKAAWHGPHGDHLAFLPKGTGACSVEMGCGTRAAESYLVTAEGFESLVGPGKHSEKWHRCWEKVQAQGHDESSAAAICTAALGDESFDMMAAEEHADEAPRKIRHEGGRYVIYSMDEKRRLASCDTLGEAEAQSKAIAHVLARRTT